MNLSSAISLAAHAHSIAVGEDGELYILHPLRIMMKMGSADERMVAVLHDIVEDTYVTIHELECMGFSKTVIDAMIAITRTKDEDYAKYIVRVANDPIARKVKIADLEDNLNICRIRRMGTRELDRIATYYAAREFLLDINCP